MCIKVLTYEALIIRYWSDCFINIIQNGFGFVSSCLDLCRQEDFLSFLLFSFQRHFFQQDLYKQQRKQAVSLFLILSIHSVLHIFSDVGFRVHVEESTSPVRLSTFTS